MNNAHNDRGGVVLIAAPPRVLLYSRLPAHALKNPIQSDARSASICFTAHQSSRPPTHHSTSPRSYYDRPIDSVSFPTELLDLSVSMGHDQMAEISTQRCGELADKRGRKDELIESIRTIVTSSSFRDRRLEDVARQIGVSGRTLRRKLKAQGTTFQKVLDETRAEYAKHYIENTALTIEQIADRKKSCKQQRGGHEFCSKNLSNAETDFGTMVYECRNCRNLHFIQSCCSNRYCPNCQQDKAEQWLNQPMKKRLPTHYFVLAITLPQGLRTVVKSHQRRTYAALFSCAYAALKKLARDTRFTGSDRIGYMAVLHTSSVSLTIYDPGCHFQLSYQED